MAEESKDKYDFSGLDEVDQKYDFSGLDQSKEDNKKDGALQTALDTALAAGQGASFNLLDELVGGARALGGQVTGQGGDFQDFLNKYKEYQKQEENRFKEAKERTPIGTTVGEIVGAIGPGVLSAGTSVIGKAAIPIAEKGATALAKRAMLAGAEVAPMGALQAAGASEGGLTTPEDREKLAKDIVAGGLVASTLGSAGSAVSGAAKGAAKKIGEKVSEIAEDTPFARLVGRAYQEGKKGTSFIGDKATEALLKQEQEKTLGYTQRLMKGQEVLGEDVGKALQNASERGVKVNIMPELEDALGSLLGVVETKRNVIGRSDYSKLSDQLTRLQSGELNPIEARDLARKVGDIADTLKDNDISIVARRFEKAVGNNLKETVPEYGKASELYHGYLKAGPETLISGSTPVDISNKYLSNLKNPEEKVFNAVNETLNNLSKLGTTSLESKKTIKSFVDNLKAFEEANPGTLKRIGLDIPSLEKDIKSDADLFAIRNLITRHDPHSRVKLKPTVSSSLAEKTALGGAVMAGKANQKIGDITKKIYGLPDEALRNFANKLESIVPMAKPLAETIRKGVDSGDSYKRNAALFTILQDPNLREHAKEFLGMTDTEEQQEESNP